MDKHTATEVIPASSTEEITTEKSKMRLLHPVTLWKYLSKFAFLLFFPLIQAVMKEPLSLVAWSNFPWVAAVSVLAVMQYLSCHYQAESGLLQYQQGIVFQRIETFPVRKITSATIRCSPILYLFGAAKLQIDTPANTSSGSDLTITLSRKELNYWWKRIAATGTKKRYHANNAKIFLMACTWSNPATGLLITGIFLQRLGQILGEQISEQLYTTVNQSHRLVALGIPPAIAAVGYLLALGWLVAVWRQFTRYANFMADKTDYGITISRGIYTRTQRLFSSDSICAVEVRQTLFMALFRLSSVYLFSPGSGSGKEERNLLLAAESKQVTPRLLQFFPQFQFITPVSLSIRPKLTVLKSFVWFPILLSFMLAFLSYQLYGTHLFILLLFFLIFSVWKTVVRFLSWKTSRLEDRGEYLVARGHSKFSLYSVVVERDKLQSYCITQNIFQRFGDTCTVRLYVGTDNRRSFTVKHVNIHLAEMILLGQEEK